MTDCRCLPVARRDPVTHAAWHALVVEQGGPASLVNAETLRAARRPVDVVRPDPATRAATYRRLVELAKRAGQHAETPPRKW